MAKAKPTQKKTTFAFTAPAALAVQLVGDFTHWQANPVEMKRDKGGTWKTSVPLDPGNYRYRFLVDGQWQDDPDCQLRVANPYGGEDSVRLVE